jgi:AcrR family transcriptional regulator
MDGRSRSNGPVTREKLIEAAGEIFAAKGLHGASIRDITKRAGANIASVNYHFHDKFELYTLVLRQAHEGVAAAMNRPLRADTPEGRVRELLSAMLTSALDPSRPKWHRQLVSRELLDPTPALDLMRDIMQRPCERLWEVIREIRPDLSDQQFMLTVSGVLAQCLFHVHHGHIAKRMFPSVSGPSLRTLIDHISEFSLAALRGLHARGSPGRRGRTRASVARPSTGATRRKPPRGRG